MTKKPTVQSSAHQSAPGRKPASHVQAALTGSVQAKLPAPAVSRQPAAHVQAALAVRTGGQAAQPRLAAGAGGSRQVASHVERSLGTLQAKPVTPQPVVQRKFVNAFEDPLLPAQAATIKERFKASAYFLRIQRTHGHTAEQVEEKLADLESHKDLKIKLSKDEFGNLYNDDNLRSIETGILSLFQKEEEERKKLIEGTWDGSTTITLAAGTELNHGNSSGVDGAAGITGQQGRAIWLTSANDVNAPSSYGERSGIILIYTNRRALKLALLNPGEQLFGFEIENWQRLFPHLDGAYTPYKLTYEVALFDKSDVQLKETRPFK